MAKSQALVLRFASPKPRAHPSPLSFEVHFRIVSDFNTKAIVLLETGTQPAREMPRAEIQNHLLKEKVLKVNTEPKLDT